jgi:hypothetical protein
VGLARSATLDNLVDAATPDADFGMVPAVDPETRPDVVMSTERVRVKVCTSLSTSRLSYIVLFFRAFLSTDPSYMETLPSF